MASSGAEYITGTTTPDRVLIVDTEASLQQPLVRLLLVGLVGDVWQVDPAQRGAVVQHDVTHVEAQDVLLQPPLQGLEEPGHGTRRRKRERI